MANCKKVYIAGELPFNCTPDDGDIFDRRKHMLHWLGVLNQPSYGLRITYDKERYVPNRHGGKTAMFSFVIQGVEAIRYNSLDDLKEAIVNCGGNLATWLVSDIEN